MIGATIRLTNGIELLGQAQFADGCWISGTVLMVW